MTEVDYDDTEDFDVILMMNIKYEGRMIPLFELNNFDAIQIGLASPEQIREWSRGEVKKA